MLLRSKNPAFCRQHWKRWCPKLFHHRFPRRREVVHRSKRVHDQSWRQGRPKLRHLQSITTSKVILEVIKMIQLFLGPWFSAQGYNREIWISVLFIHINHFTKRTALGIARSWFCFCGCADWCASTMLSHIAASWSGLRLNKKKSPKDPGSGYQIGWIFGKIPDGLWPPSHFQKIILQILYNGYGCMQVGMRTR